MKKILLLILITIMLFAQNVISQSTWTWQYPYPQGNTLYDVYSFNPNSMIAVGKLGSIVKTNDGGQTWTIRNRVNNISSDFRNVYFIDNNTGWISTSTSQILKTINGGNTWNEILVSSPVYTFFFLNNLTGFAGSSGGNLFKTSNGGNNWVSMNVNAANFTTLNIHSFDENNIWLAGVFSNMQGGTGAVLRTTNGGLNWTNTSPEPLLGGGIYTSIQFLNNLTGFASGSRGTHPRLFKTIDGGNNWDSIATGLLKPILDMRFNDVQTGWVSCLNGIFKTTDSGISWVIQYTPLIQGSPQNPGFNLSFSNETGFAVGFVDILHTTNSGNDWQKISKSDVLYEFRKIRFLNSNTGWSNGYDGLIKTTNGGNNWDTLTIEGMVSTTDFQIVDENNFWITGIGTKPLQVTFDGGVSWNNINIGLTNLIQVDFLNPTSGFVFGKNGNMFVSARTTDKGGSWSLDTIVGPYSNTYSADIQFTDFNTGYSLIRDKFYKTTDSGNNWFEKSLPVKGTYNKFQFINSSTGFVSARLDIFNPVEIYKTTDGGDSYLPMNAAAFGLTEVTALHFFDGSNGVAFLNSFDNANYECMMIKTTNGGQSWSSQYNGTWQAIDDITFLNQDVAYICGYGSAILKSTDMGFNIQNSVSGIVKYQDNNQHVSSGYVKAFKHSSIGDIIVEDSVAIQSDGSYTIHIPHDTTDLMAFQNDEVTSFSFVPTYYPSSITWQNAGHIYTDTNMTGMDISVYRITNDGLSHGKISGSVLKYTDQPLTGVGNAIIYAKLGNVYKGYGISNSNGAYFSDSLPNGLYQLTCNRMGYPTKTRFVYLNNTNLTDIDFIFGSPLTGIQEGNEIPDNYSLSQNYPNPFNPTTTFKFALPNSSMTKLVVYDLLGREVSVLVNEQLNAGNYKVDWNALNYSSGVYFYKIEAGNFTDVKKLVLIK